MIKCVVSSSQFVKPVNTPRDLKLSASVFSILSKLQFFHDCLHLLIMPVATYNSFRTIALFPSYWALSESIGYHN